MKIVTVIMVVLLLSGCAEFRAVKNGIGFYGAQASDETLSTAIWTVCKATPVGAVNRRFQSSEQMETWSALCADVPEAPR